MDPGNKESRGVQYP